MQAGVVDLFMEAGVSAANPSTRQPRPQPASGHIPCTGPGPCGAVTGIFPCRIPPIPIRTDLRPTLWAGRRPDPRARRRLQAV